MEPGFFSETNISIVNKHTQINKIINIISINNIQ